MFAIDRLAWKAIMFGFSGMYREDYEYIGMKLYGDPLAAICMILSMSFSTKML